MSFHKRFYDPEMAERYLEKVSWQVNNSITGMPEIDNPLCLGSVGDKQTTFPPNVRPKRCPDILALCTEHLHEERNSLKWYLLLTGDAGDLWKRKLQQNLLLVVDDVHSRPVDGNYDVILGQIWAWNTEQNHFFSAKSSSCPFRIVPEYRKAS